MANIPTFEEWRKKKDAEESAAKQRDVSPASYNNAPSYAEWVQSERGQSVARGDVATYSQRAPYMAQTQAARRAAVQRVLDQQNLQREADILADRAQRGVSSVWQNRPAPGGTGMGQTTQTTVRESVGYDETIDRAATPGAVYGISAQPMGGAIGGALPYAQGQTRSEEENVAEGERIYNEYLTRREDEARNALYQPVDPNQSSIEAYGDAVRQLQDDDSDYRIQPNWTEGERRTFYDLIGSGREGAAQSYARRVNREAVAYEERQNREAVSSRAQEQTERATAYTSGVVDALTDSEGNIFDRALNVAKSVFSIGKSAKSAAATAGLAAQTLGASIAQVFTGGADFLTDLLNYSAGRGIVDDGAVTPNEWANEYNAGVAQALNDAYGTINLGDNILGYVFNGKGVGDIYALATSMLNSRIAMAVGNRPFTLISFFGQAASSGIDEAKERGATDEAALVYGAVVGAAEAVSEFLGIEKLLKTPTPVNFATWLKNIVGQGATEGAEEGFSAIISAISDTILGAADDTYNSVFREAVSQYMTANPDATEQDAARHAWRVIIGDVVFSMLGGFITGTAQGGIQSGINTVRTDRQLQSEYGDTYRARSVEMAADETLPKNVRKAAERAATQYATRGRASTANLAQLLNYENTQQYEADLAAIKSEAARMLSANGETQNVDAIAAAIAKRIVQERAAAAVESDRYALRGYADAVQRRGVAEYADSLDLTARESRALNRSANAEQVTAQLADYTAQNAQISADSAMAAEADQAAATDAAFATDEIQAAQSVDTDADGNAVVIDTNRPIASLRNGKVMLNLEGGGTVDASSVVFARESDAMKYAALAELENITDLAAESMMLRINDGADAHAQIMGMYEAYMAGRYGISHEMSEASGSYANYITAQQRADLYRVGNAERMEERSRLEREERETADRNRNAARNYRRGTVTLPNGVSVDTANAETAREKRRAAAVETANVLAGALGIDIVFYESQGDATKPNGYYKNGVIYLDLDAGESGQGVTMYTMAHELTHYIREWSPAKYRVLADFLVEQYNDTYRGNAEDLTINDLVAAQQEKAKRNNDTLTYDQAFEEFVADSLSGVLMSGKAIDRMIELRKRDATLYERMKSALRRYTNRVRRYLREGYEGIDPETQEGLAVAAVDGAMDKLELIFADAALQASNNMMVFIERVADSPVTESPVSVTDFASASYRGGTVGTREILTRALSTEADEKERRALDRYRKTIADIEALEKRYNELGEQLKELRSTRANARDVAKIAALTSQRDAIAAEIVQKDSALLKLQSTAALKELVKRERAAAARATKASATLANERRKDLYTMRELRGKIIDAAKSLDDMVSKRDKKNPIMEHLREPVKQVLAMLRTNVEDAFGNTVQGSGNADAFYAVMDSLYARYSDLETADGVERTVWNEETASFIKAARDALGEDNTVTDLNTEQLLDVYKALRAVLGSVRGENTLFATERRETAVGASIAVEREIDAVTKGKKKGARNNLVRGLSRFGWNMLTPQTAFNLIGSPTLQRLFSNVEQGSYEWYRSIETARDKRREIDRKYNVRNWDTKKQYELTDAYGKKFTVSLQQMLSLYALSRRDAAKTHLMSGGIILVDDTKRGWFDKYEDRSTADHSFTEEQIANMGANLTEEQRGYVESMVDYLSGDLAKAGNAASMKLLGMELFTEKNYFPMKTYLFHEMENRESVDIMASMRNYGFTNSTKPDASSPLLIRSFGNVWDTHVNQMSLYATMMLPLEDFSRVYNINNTRENIRGARVAEIVERVYGREANDYIRKLFRDINGGVQRFDGESNFLGKLVSSMKRASIFGSASVVIQQPTSIYRALAYIDPKYFFGRRIANASTASLSREWEQLVAHAPIAGLKEMGYFDVNMGAGVSEYLNEPDATFAERVKMLKDANIRRQTINEFMGKGIEVADEIGWVTLWDAVKREQADKHPNANHNSKAFLDMCGKRFAEIASATQVYDSVLSRSGFMRGNEYTKAFTMFMSEPTLMVNMMVNAFLDAKRGDKRAAARTAAAVAASIIMNTLAVSLIYAIRDDDEDETFVEKYAQSVLRESADAINPMSYLPFFRDIHAALMGYDQERPEYSKIVDVITNITRMSNAAAKLVSEDMDEDRRREQVRTFINNAMRSAMSVVDAFGFPGSNLYRIITSAGNVSNLLTNGLPNNMRRFGELLVDEAAMAFPTPLRPWVKLAVNSDEERLLNAAQNGDYAYLNRIRAQHEPTESIFGTYHIEQAIAADDAKLVDIIKTDRINAYKADGVSAEDAKQKWESSVRNAVSNLVEDGTFSKGDAEKYLTKYGGKTRADAEESAAKIAYNATYDIPYYDIEDEWGIGKITDSRAVQMIVDYGYDRPYAQRRVKAFGYAKQYADLESGAVQDWLEKRDTHPETQTVSEPVYVQYRYKIRDIEGDGKKSRIMAVIHALPLSTAQKDALYFDAGYAESTLDEAPWYQ